LFLAGFQVGLEEFQFKEEIESQHFWLNTWLLLVVVAVDFLWQVVVELVAI
jgi:hypothetical protein